MIKMTEKKGQVVPKTTRDLTPFEEMDRLFDRMFEGGYLRPFDWRMPDFFGRRGHEEWMPRIDLIDRDDRILVRAEIPGVRRDGLEVTLSDDYLTIKGETREEKEEKGEVYRSEIRRGTFTRTLRLPAEVKGEEAKARFEDGMLEITIPKKEQKTKHTVKVE